MLCRRSRVVAFRISGSERAIRLLWCAKRSWQSDLPRPRSQWLLAPPRPHTYLPWLMAVGVGSGMGAAGIFAFSQTLAGPQAAGRWTGLQNGFANLAGVVAPALTGFAVGRTGNFVAPMAITTVVLIVGAIAWVFVVGRVEQVNWAVHGEVYDGAALC